MTKFLAATVICVAVIGAACSSSDSVEADDNSTTTLGPTTSSTVAPDTTTTLVDPTTTAAPVDDVAACVGDDWVVVDTGPFTFRTPADMVDQNAQGIDSLYGQFVGDELDLAFDFGWYSPNLGEMERLGATPVSVSLGGIEGAHATADVASAGFSRQFATQLYAQTDVSNALWMGVNYDRAELTAIAECIVSSVRFG